MTDTNAASGGSSESIENSTKGPNSQVEGHVKLAEKKLIQESKDNASEFDSCGSNVAVFSPSIAPSARQLQSETHSQAHSQQQNIQHERMDSNSTHHRLPSATEVSTLSSTSPLSRVNTANSISGLSRTTTVRRNWLQHILRNYSNIPRTSKILLFFSLITHLMQIIASTIVISVTWNMDCDTPLSTYLLVTILRLAILLPIDVLHYLSPPGREYQSANLVWVKRFRSFLDVFSMLFFVLGNYLLFTSETCKNTAPALFYFCLTLVIWGYFIITIPVFFCGAIIFCLPCVLVFMRVLHINENAQHGATQEYINKLPKKKFKVNKSLLQAIKASNDSGDNPQDSDKTVGDHQHTDNTSNTNLSNGSATSQPTRNTMQWLWKTIKSKTISPDSKNLKNNSSNGKRKSGLMKLHNSSTPTLYLNNDDEATCSICICDYEDNEDIRVLTCDHHFHVQCVDEWLKLNSTCPLCKRNILATIDSSDSSASLSPESSSSPA